MKDVINGLCLYRLIDYSWFFMVWEFIKSIFKLFKIYFYIDGVNE